ncbi:GatB/YqeY domain-containing protein [Bdellovibrionota bacterium]
MTKSASSALKGKIDAAFIEAQKAKDALRVSTFRMLRAEIKNKEIELKEKSLDDENVLKVISTAIKKRKDSIELYKKGDRQELAEKEEKEMEILAAFLPEQLSEEEVEKIVAKAIEDTGATGPKEMGQVMKAVIAEVKGRADGKLISQLVRKKLNC